MSKKPIQYGHHPLSERRKQIYIDTLRLTASPVRAAAAASAHSKARHPGYSTFINEMQRNPEFREQCINAKAEGMAVMEAEAHRRAVSGVVEPIVSGGEVVAQKIVYSDRLLELLLRAGDPARFGQQSNVKLSGTVTHQTAPALQLTPNDLHCLDEEDRADLERIVRRICEHRKEPEDFGTEPLALPPAEL